MIFVHKSDVFSHPGFSVVIQVFSRGIKLVTKAVQFVCGSLLGATGSMVDVKIRLP